MRFNTIVPILYSDNVTRSLTYYTQALGFSDKWEWDDPPTFAGVYRDGVQIFFCEKGQGHPGTWLSVMVDDVDEFHESVRAKGAIILSTPKDMEWGIREMLIEDPDGHKIRFGHSIPIRKKSAERMPGNIRITSRIPTAHELHRLVTAVGWKSPEPSREVPLGAVMFVASAEVAETGELVGCAFLLGDHSGFYHIKNVIVHPQWQGKRIGTALMKELTRWLENHAPDHSLVTLNTGESFAPFYKQFGFSQAYSMHRIICR